jgi:hypothetical protein
VVLTRVLVRRIIMILAGLACLSLCLVVLVSRPDPNEDLWLAWAGISAGIGLAAELILL